MPRVFHPHIAFHKIRLPGYAASYNKQALRSVDVRMQLNVARERVERLFRERERGISVLHCAEELSVVNEQHGDAVVSRGDGGDGEGAGYFVVALVVGGVGLVAEETGGDFEGAVVVWEMDAGG